MSKSVFIDKGQLPTEPQLAQALGQAMQLWSQLKTALSNQYPPLTEEWVHSGKNYGWALRLKQKKRAILYLTPCDGFFRVGLALGEKATQAARQSKLPAALMDLIEQAPKYVEGRAIRFDVRGEKEIRYAEQLAAFKMSH